MTSPAAAPGELHIGTSGWTYASWRGTVFPTSVPDRERLEYYALRLFNSVELNASYYRWPGLSTFQGWNRRLPEGFRMTVKAPKGLTHVNRLADPQEWISRIIPCLEALGPRLGMFLVQLPPSLHRDDALLDAFLTEFARGFSKQTMDEHARAKVAVEFRHDSWLADDVFAFLRQHDAAYVVMDGPKMTTHLDRSMGSPTACAHAPDVYLRFHGPAGSKLYGGSYTDAALGAWAERIRGWLADGRDVWAYFNNDIDGAAVANARTLRRLCADGGA